MTDWNSSGDVFGVAICCNACEENANGLGMVKSAPSSPSGFPTPMGVVHTRLPMTASFQGAVLGDRH